MRLTDILAQTGGLSSIARELGLSEQQAASGAAALTPAILGGLQKQAQTQASTPEGLGGLLSRLGGGGLLDNVVSQQPTDVSQGNQVLGQIFGSKDVSRTVAQHASNQSGLSADLLKKMLPMLAMLVTGYLAKHHGNTASNQQSSGGGLGGMLGGLLGGNASGGGGLGGLGALLGMGGSGGGNALDDILKSVGR
ncbi:MAG: DUF937 domain-containing protein [Gemmatimonadota bacterium]